MIIDWCDQCYSNLLDSRGHYTQPLEISNQLGLLGNIRVINCLILNCFLDYQPWPLNGAIKAAINVQQSIGFGTTQTDRCRLRQTGHVPHECLDKATDRSFFTSAPLEETLSPCGKYTAFSGFGYLRMKHPPHRETNDALVLLLHC